MPYTIPDPLKLAYDAQLPLGHYTAYVTWYGANFTSKRVPINFRVVGYTKSGSMKIRFDASRRISKDKITRQRKDGNFMIPTENEGHGGKQITDVYPYHKSVSAQKEKETYDCVAGEAIIFHPTRSGWLGA